MQRNITITLFISLFLSTIVNAAGIKGHIYDSGTHKPVPFSEVYILDSKLATVADDGGLYLLKNLKKGNYKIASKCLGYNTSATKQIKISNPDSVVIVEIYLEPSVKEINEVLVKGNQNKETNISARKDEKVALNVINIISAKTIETLPDLNVADVMQRVSGVSMVKNNASSNSHLIIRGMPSRYNNSLLNGVALPKSASLDMFGSEMVGRVEVIKALTPDVEGNAIGGAANIVLKDAPEKAFFNAQLSTGYNQYFFNNSFLTFDKEAVNQKDFSEQFGSSFVPKVSDFSRKNLIIISKNALPNLQGNISVGRRFFNNHLGFMIALSAQNSTSANTYNYTSPSSNPDNSYKVGYWESQKYCKQQQRYGTNIKLDYQFNKNHSISLYNSFFLLNETRARSVIDTLSENNRTVPGTGTVHTYYQTITDNSYVENFVVKGNHKILNNLLIDWSVIYTEAYSHSPDYAQVYLTQTINTPGANTPTYLNYSSCVTREWQWDIGQDKAAAINIEYKPFIFNNLFNFKAGGMAKMKYRKNYANEYDFNFNPTDGTYPNPDIMTVPLTFKNTTQAMGNAVNNPGNYRAYEDLQAVYGQVSTTIGKLDILAGTRVEFTYMENYHNQNNIQLPVVHARFSYYDVLPSVHLNYKFTDKQNLRASFYQAINRPDYTEVIPYSDPRPGGQTGNDKLRHSVGSSFDLRYEIYPDQEDVITAGIFYKSIKNAIEEFLKPGSESKTLGNAPHCTNYGFELVVMKQFGNFGFNGNYTYTQSRINQAENYNVWDSLTTHNWVTIQKMETRPLVGQSAHLINIGLNYQDPKLGIKFSLAYTMQGKYLVNVSTDVFGRDTYTRSIHNLGFSAEKSLSKKLKVNVKVGNLLNYPISRYTKDGYFIEKQYNYQSYFIGLKLNI